VFSDAAAAIAEVRTRIRPFKNKKGRCDECQGRLPSDAQAGRKNMNKHLHRVIFNAARGLRVVVQETARSVGKATGTRPAIAAGALFGVLVALPGQAQIVGAQNVPGALRPTVLVAPNGVPLVNIQTPSAAGVSRNLYQQFDVQRGGVRVT
jgi:hypothetical protein